MERAKQPELARKNKKPLGPWERKEGLCPSMTAK
jgi:hypothetical protein